MTVIRRIREAVDIERCYPVMAQLRPHLTKEEFVARTQRQFETQAYHLAALETGGEVVSVAGYRLAENLVWGRYLYVDDLVTDEACRGRGYGGRLFDWLVDETAREQCRALHLDSGIQRFAAHRFYLGKRMEVTCRHFGLPVAG